MEWWVVLIFILGVLMAFFLSGMPVAFAFLSLNIIGFVVFLGGFDKLNLLLPSAFAVLASFSWTAVPLFVLMGEVLFETGLARLMVDSLGKWVGRLPGSLSLLGVGAGTLFAMMSGSAVSGVAVFGSTLVPEMRSRGYKKAMIFGPIMAAGSLATLIPPSITAVLVASLSQQSVGKMLMAGVIPGFLMASFFAIYILIRARLQPGIAPAFVPPQITWGAKFKALAMVSPLSLLIFLVLGLIFLGVSTPSEAAALGATGAFILALAYRRLNINILQHVLKTTVKVTAMVFMIIVSAAAFSQILAFSGVMRELSSFAVSLPVPPLLIVFATQVVLIVMGMFIDDFSMLMITIPIFFPIIRVLNLDPLWYGLLLMMNIQIAIITPPFGMSLFTMKGVVPDANMTDIYKSAIPIFIVVFLLLIVIMFFPALATWLPGKMMT